jgi:hypothetical protein
VALEFEEEGKQGTDAPTYRSVPAVRFLHMLLSFIFKAIKPTKTYKYQAPILGHLLYE